MDKQPLLRLNKIRKRFGNVHALKGVSFELKKGEVHSILGANGAGKSTLMKVIAGVYQKDGGEVFVDGKKVNIQNPSEARSCGISIVHQEFSLMNDLNTVENIFVDDYPLKVEIPPIVDFKKMRKLALSIFEKMGVYIDVDKLISDLPVGERQIVEIAKALKGQTKVLILDEPTSALNSKEIEKLFQLISVLKKQGVGII